jgi:aminopeptidase N
VRAAAIDLLAVWDPNKYQNAFLRLVNEPSYLVAGSALMGLISASENPIEPEIIERFSNEVNFRITIPVAEYYISQNVKGKAPWFLGRLNQLYGEGLYYYMGYFSEYFTRFPEEGKEEAVKQLLNILEKDSKSYVRLGAFQALLGFSDDEEVVKKVQKAIELEKDADLKNYYNYFLEALK